jgi:TolA-binding protein
VLSRPDATIYQFIGVAVPAKNPKKMKVATTTPLDIISIEIESLQKSHAAEVQRMQTELDKLDTEVRRLDAELSGILNSRSWKAVRKVHSIKATIVGRKHVN